MGDLTDSLPPSTAPQRPAPFREDCWSEDATSTLVDAWGRRYMELNRGNLRQKDWQEVADSVNARHGHVKKARRTDVQCKNRIDTIKKKYKIEKARVTSSNGALTSSWPFFSRLDALIGPTMSAKKPSSVSPPLALPLPYWKTPSPAAPSASVGALPQKRPMPAVDDSYFRRNYSAVAAAAAAEAVDEDDDDDEEEEESRWSAERSGDVDGMRQLARAIERFGEIYEKVEAEKQKQMFELEKQRMQFVKDVEFQRMKMFMDTQVQLEKIKRAKKSGLNDSEAVNNFSLLCNSGGLTPSWLL